MRGIGWVPVCEERWLPKIEMKQDLPLFVCSSCFEFLDTLNELV